MLADEEGQLTVLAGVMTGAEKESVQVAEIPVEKKKIQVSIPRFKRVYERNSRTN